MGTRAVIKFEGKPLVATHYDGYPDSLGKILSVAKPKNPSSVLKIAKQYSIDAVDKKYMPALEKKRAEEISKKFNLPLKKVASAHKKGRVILRGNIISSQDYPIGNINEYDDFAEYEYNVKKDGSVEMRALGIGSGYQKDKLEKIPFKILSHEKKKLKEMS